MKKERILITGGAGFIGSHTADALAQKAYKIRILDNLEPVVHRNKWPSYLRDRGYELVRGDVRNKKDWEKALHGVSYVYHFAAHQDQRPDFGKFFHTNTVGTALLYEVIVEKRLPVKKIVAVSSQFAYGDGKYVCPHDKKFFFPEPRGAERLKRGKFDILCLHKKPAKFIPFNESQPLTPTNSYGLSKEALERLALRLGKTHGIPTTILRYSVVQGVRQSPRNLYSGALRIFVTQALAKKPITVFEDGKQTRDFVNIKDVIAANLLVLHKKETNFEIFNVGGERAWSVFDFAILVKRLARSASSIKIGGFRSTDTRHSVSNISKLRRLGWRPRFTPEDSVREYIEWYKANFSRRK